MPSMASRAELWAGGLGSALAVVAVGLLAEAVYSPRWSPLETGAFEVVLATRTPWMDWIALAFTQLGGPLVLLLVAAAAAFLGWPSRAKADRIGLLLVLLAASSANALLKAWFGRPRPGPDFHPLRAEPYSSFPSGHAMLSLCLYGFLAWLVLRSPMPCRRRRALFVALWGLVLGIGLSRIYLAVHYPGDVVGGYAAGLPILWAALAIDAASRPKV